MKTSTYYSLILAVTVCVVNGAADAQVVREDGTDTIAGLLSPNGQKKAYWTFRSAGNEILFASLDAEIYLPFPGGHSDTHETVDSTCDDGSSCGDETDEGCGGSGGPGRFYLAVYGPAGRICYAERPAPPPGWQRDPRLACVLPAGPADTKYKIEVGLREKEHEESNAQYPFLLNLSLRRLANVGSVVQAAVAKSLNQGW